MNNQQKQLYQRIQNFSLDQENARFPFSKKLAKEKNWSRNYTQKVIAEYKKFAFLAVVAGHPVSPSKAIDEVWHLHLTYTQSYWNEFCPKILGKPLHHYPSKGDPVEDQKFEQWYQQTLNSYQQIFGEQPPADVWGVTNPIKSKKLAPIRFFSFSPFLLFVPLLGITLIANIPNPLNFPGPQFLNFYLFVLVIGVFLSFCIRWYGRTPRANPTGKYPHLDLYETAYLAEGNKYLLEVAIANLVKKEYLKPVADTKELEILKPLPAESHPLEKAIIDGVEKDRKISQIRRLVLINPENFKEKLTSLGLLVSANQQFPLQFYSALIMFIVFLLGVVKIIIGIARHKPVGFLIILAIISLVIGLAFLSIQPFRSRFGDSFLSHLQEQNSGLQKGQNTDVNLGLAIALFGLSILDYSSCAAFSDLKQVLAVTPISNGDGGSCSGGGCGGGSCGGGCGGGCGGCSGG